MNTPNAVFTFSDDGMELVFVDALANLTAFSYGSSGGITFRNQSERDAFMDAVDQEQAIRSGDFETEPKMDELNTEAWLDY